MYIQDTVRIPLEFEWDQEKSDATLAQRGIDFAYAARVFLGPVLELPSNREGEERTKAIGEIEGSCYSVVYTIRQGRYRIISARRGWKSEERAYRAAHPG